MGKQATPGDAARSSGSRRPTGTRPKPTGTSAKSGAAPKGSGKPTGAASRTPAAAGGGEPPRGWQMAEVVVGRVAPSARVAGVLAIAAALCLAVRPFLTLATVDGEAVGSTTGLFGLLGWLPAIVLLAAGGGALTRGRLPRVWLAVIGSAAALALGAGIRVIWLLGSSRTVVDLPVGGQMLAGDRYDVAAGLVLELVAMGLLVLAGLCVLAGWAGTVMDDSGRFDRHRPRLGVACLLLGTLAGVAFAVPPGDADVGLLAPSVIQRSGLDRVGTWVFIAAIVLCCVAAVTLRPWLAVAGGLAGAAAMLLGWGVENLVVVLDSPDLSANWGTGMQLALPVLIGGAAALALALKADPDGPDPDADSGAAALGTGYAAA